MRRTGDRLSEYASRVSDSAGNLAAGVSDRAAAGAESLRTVSGESASAVGDMLSPQRMKRTGERAGDWVNEAVSGNPLIAGALGLAVGAVIAAALPSTAQEDRFLGSAADDLKAKARAAALDRASAAKEIAAEMYEEAASRAKTEGLSADNAREFAGHVGEKIKTAVSNVTGDKQPAGDGENSSQTSSGAAG